METFSLITSLKLLVLAQVLQIVSSSGRISIKLLHFENQKGLLPDGTCCDGFQTRTTICAGCEYYFIICISDPSSHQPCSIQRIWTDDLAFTNYYSFTSTIMVMPDYNEIKNPLVFPLKKWNGSLALNVGVFDDDKGNTEWTHLENDHVTTMQKNVSILASSKADDKKMVLLTGKQRQPGIFPKMSMEISVTCDANYLIPTCTDYCIDKNDNTGHYRCNYTAGIRECLPGWYGEKCLKKVTTCTPRDDGLGHYSCNKLTGEKICLPGWRNAAANCTDAILRTSTKVLQSTRAFMTSSTRVTSKLSSIMASSLLKQSMIPHTVSAAYESPQQTTTTTVIGNGISRHIPQHTTILSPEMTPSITMSSIQPSVSLPGNVMARKSYLVYLKGDSKKMNSNALSVVQRTICEKLRMLYFRKDVPCIFSNSSTSNVTADQRSIIFKQNMVNTSSGRGILEVSVVDRKDRGSSTAQKDAIMSAQYEVKKKTALEMTLRDSQKPTTFISHESLPMSSIAPPVNQKPKPKASYDLRSIGAITLAAFLMAIMVVIILIISSRKKKTRKVQPFRQDKELQEMTNCIVSSRSTASSNLSASMVDKAEERSTSVKDGDVQLANQILAFERNSSRAYLSSPEVDRKHKFTETNFQGNRRSANRPIHFIPPPVKHISRKSSVL